MWTLEDSEPYFFRPWKNNLSQSLCSFGDGSVAYNCRRPPFTKILVSKSLTFSVQLQWNTTKCKMWIPWFCSTMVIFVVPLWTVPGGEWGGQYQDVCFINCFIEGALNNHFFPTLLCPLSPSLKQRWCLVACGHGFPCGVAEFSARLWQKYTWGVVGVGDLVPLSSVTIYQSSIKRDSKTQARTSCATV